LKLYAPPLGGLLRAVFGWERHWLQFVPAAAGVFWIALRRSRKIATLRCAQDGAPRWQSAVDAKLLLVSVCFSPYGWLFDQVVLLPAVVEMAVRGLAAPRRYALALLLIFLALNGAVLVLEMGGAPIVSWAYWWTAPAWLALYAAADRLLPAATVAPTAPRKSPPYATPA
jgi:hypothetical protein